MSNNPFASASASQNVLNPFNQPVNERFPSIEIPGHPNQPQVQPQATGAYYAQAPAYAPQPQPQSYAPQQSQPNGFQPSSSFGQQLQAQVNQYAHVQDLDPYGAVPSNWQQPQQQRQPSPQPPRTPTPATSSYGAHPRQIVQNSKEALERWDAGAWRSFHARVDELTRAWEGRKSTVLRALDGRNLGPDEAARFQAVRALVEQMTS
jgi:hypothetical protein